MDKITIKFELTFEEANAVLFSLGKMPYDQVAALVEKLRQQAAPQLPSPGQNADFGVDPAE